MKLVELIRKYARKADLEDKETEGQQHEEASKQELKMGLPVVDELQKAKVKKRWRTPAK
jgi:hypothetical protein